MNTPGHIGIVAVSPEGASLCYRQLFRHASALYPDSPPPRVTIHNEPLQTYIERVQADDWAGVADLLLTSVRLLHKAGASFVLTPDNAVQHGVMIAEHDSPIPWLTMTDLVTDALVEKGHSTVGVLGTRYVTQGSAYQTTLGLKGIKLQAPDEQDVIKMDEIIFKELIFGTINPLSELALRGIVARLKDRGSESLIVAASELRLLLDRLELPLPVFDAADLLAIGAVRRASKG